MKPATIILLHLICQYSYVFVLPLLLLILLLLLLLLLYIYIAQISRITAQMRLLQNCIYLLTEADIVSDSKNVEPS